MIGLLAISFLSPIISSRAQDLGEEVFVPSGGFIRTIKAQQLERLRAEALELPGAPPATIGGTRLVPVICIEFANRPGPFPVADYRQMLFDPTPGKKTFTQYYSDMSEGRLNVSGEVVGWYKLPKNDAYYESNRNGNGPPFGEMLRLALEKADSELDFARFDNDGEDGRPNSGDDDGKVDFVFFIHPEYGGECGGPNIWSHSGHYSSRLYGHTSPFVTKAVRLDGDGQPVLGPDGPVHIVVDDYTIQPGLACPGPENQKKLVEVGVFCHEFGHALGLPDLYDRTSPPPSSGLGHWCLMSHGNLGGDGKRSHSPVSLGAWCKEFLGWAAVVPITSDTELRLEPAAERNLCYRFDLPNADSQEYFLVELRDPDWRDPRGVKVNWDEGVPARGLAIWHVDNSVGRMVDGNVNLNWPFAPKNKGQNDEPSISFGPKHALVALLQADQLQDLEKGRGRGDSGDLLTSGMVFADDPKFLFGSRSYSGEKSGIELRGVDLAQSKAYAKKMPASDLALAPARPSDVGADGEALDERASAPPVAEDMATPAELERIKEVDRATAEILTSAPGVPDKKQRLPFLAAKKLQTRPPGRFESDISDRVRKTIRDAQSWEISAAVQPMAQQQIRALGAEARTKEIRASSLPANAVEAKVVELLRQSDVKTPAQVTVSPGNATAQRVLGLKVPLDAPGAVEQEPQLLVNEFQSLLGPGVTLNMITNRTKPEGGAIQFEQTIDAAGQTLPIFETEVTLIYTNAQKSTVTSLVNKTFPPSTVQIDQTEVTLDAGDASQLVAARLKLPAQQLKQPRLGIFLVGGNPSKGRLAYSVPVNLGTNHQDVRVFVDAQTKQILEIK